MAGDRRDDDAGSIAWPGFVDILSSVLMMFLFFIMITSFVMFAMNSQLRKKMQEESKRHIEEAVSGELREKLQKLLAGDVSVEELRQMLENPQPVQENTEAVTKLEEKNLALNNEVTELKKVLEQVKKQTTAGTEQASRVAEDNSLLIIYSNNDVSLSEQTTKVIEAYIQTVGEKLKGRKFNVRILTSDNPNAASISLSREISLARSLNVRNVLLKQNILSAAIEVSYSKPLVIDDTHNWLKVMVEVDDS
jgi:hypothetical protein